MADLMKALRGELNDCTCMAHSSSECACSAVWPEGVADEAADEIERLRASLSECVAVMEKNIYPKPDVGPGHPYSVLCRARDLTSDKVDA